MSPGKESFSCVAEQVLSASTYLYGDAGITYPLSESIKGEE
jgi:hypothetical protein